MTLSAMFDESGKFKDCEQVVFAGFIGEQDKWNGFSHDWNVRLLRNMPRVGGQLPFLHMVELNRRHKKSSDSVEKLMLETLVADLAQVICKYATEGFANSITVADFNALDPIARARYKDPFYYAFEAGVKSISTSAALGEKDNVMLICDDSEEYSVDCLRAYRRMKQKQPDLLLRVPCITFGDDKQYPPLQAADMYAYCVRSKLASAADGLWNEPLKIIHECFSEHVKTDILLHKDEVERGKAEITSL
jgi:hypothetical protein